MMVGVAPGELVARRLIGLPEVNILRRALRMFQPR
jgi:hypothetical protein